MRVLVAGATGVIGRQLVPVLISAGHEVVAVSRGRSQAPDQVGVTAVVADILDRGAITRVVREQAPDAIVHIATAIPAEINPKKLAADFEATNRLRTEGTRNLIEAASEAGVGRVVTEGLAYAYDPSSSTPAAEGAPLWQAPPKQFAPVLEALQELERLTAQANGLVLRFGHLYGPGSIYASDGSFVNQVRAGKVPLVGGGTSTFSFTHSYDAATAILAAVQSHGTGSLNIVDDEPAQMSVWLPVLADILGARKPKGAPAMMAKLAVGDWGVAFMTKLRGADNSNAKRSLDWQPKYTSWRTGFVSELQNGKNG
ncbi:MAG TPA: NAD(P)-dependent oxidoreductase [Jatrophihabitans sp.]|jgi:nucleoside-diphosphate-sugar epimerase|uniref:NAD-dependent epimerase/dehydratase family protein n=1 Tax=Jatrophihabitans sp. TaxID=1932789 RepID=UPI002EDBF4A5